MRPGEIPVPSLHMLGRDLTRTTTGRLVFTLARPFVAVYLFLAAARAGWWWATPLIVLVLFVVTVVVLHDVVHRALGLGPRGTDFALAVLGLVLLSSGHAYRATHLQHHRAFLRPDDPEGRPARFSAWGALLHGPGYVPRLWLWAFRRSRHRFARLWMLGEASMAGVVVAVGCICRASAPGILLYAVMVIVGSWVYPYLTVYVPHRTNGRTPLERTLTLRGRIIPAVFLGLSYHLEHHLYPAAPSHHMAELARRLDPMIQEAGMRIVQVP